MWSYLKTEYSAQRTDWRPSNVVVVVVGCCCCCLQLCLPTNRPFSQVVVVRVVAQLCAAAALLNLLRTFAARLWMMVLYSSSPPLWSVRPPGSCCIVGVDAKIFMPHHWIAESQQKQQGLQAKQKRIAPNCQLSKGSRPTCSTSIGCQVDAEQRKQQPATMCDSGGEDVLTQGGFWWCRSSEGHDKVWIVSQKEWKEMLRTLCMLKLPRWRFVLAQEAWDIRGGDHVLSLKAALSEH